MSIENEMIDFIRVVRKMADLKAKKEREKLAVLEIKASRNTAPARVKQYVHNSGLSAKAKRELCRKPIEPDWNLSSKACTAVRKYKRKLV
jgi:hypothetical protein